MNFTREPVIETILSPRDGHKLCVRNSKIPQAEELLVDAVEVVSFGQAFFFRGQERPKPFLVPVTDYEVFEVKETRVVLKNVPYERNIKIGGGRDSFPKGSKEPAKEVEEESEEVATEGERENKTDKKRERRRNRRKKMAEDKKEFVHKKDEELADSLEEGSVVSKEGAETILTEPRLVPSFSQLLPPPPTLISESIARMKAEAAKAEAEANAQVDSSVEVSEVEIPEELST